MCLKIRKTFKVEFYLISRFQCVVNKRNVGLCYIWAYALPSLLLTWLCWHCLISDMIDFLLCNFMRIITNGERRTVYTEINCFHGYPGLQKIAHNEKYFYFSTKIYVVGTQISTHNICIYWWVSIILQFYAKILILIYDTWETFLNRLIGSFSRITCINGVYIESSLWRHVWEGYHVIH